MTHKNLLVRFQNAGIHFCSLSEGINTTTPGGKLVNHVFSATAEFQREIIVENTVAGMDAARRRGKHVGRPYSLTPDAIATAHSAIMQGKRSKAELALALGVSRSTIDRAFERMGLAG